MAIRRIYFGTVGPFLYDDADPIAGPGFPGEDYQAIVTDGQMYIDRVPVAAKEVVRLEDLPYGNVDVNFADVTGARALGTSYQNAGAGALIVQITVRLRL